MALAVGGGRATGNPIVACFEDWPANEPLVQSKSWRQQFSEARQTLQSDCCTTAPYRSARRVRQFAPATHPLGNLPPCWQNLTRPAFVMENLVQCLKAPGQGSLSPTASTVQRPRSANGFMLSGTKFLQSRQRINSGISPELSSWSLTKLPDSGFVGFVSRQDC